MGIKFKSSSISLGNSGLKLGASSSGKGLSLSLGINKDDKEGTGHDVPLISRVAPTKYNEEYLSKLTNGNEITFSFGGDESSKEYGLLKYIYRQLFSEYVPDISGYTLLFLVPPDLSGYINAEENEGTAAKKSNYNQVENDSGFIGWTSKMVPFLASQFTAPQIQMNSSTLTSTSGSQQYASELQITDNMSVTYMETDDLDVYSFHRTWVNYISEILEGNIKPGFDSSTGDNYIYFRTIDYASSFYFVKFRPDLETITYIGKAIGCFPKELPSTELIGNRGTNELTTLSFNYAVSDFREVTYREAATPMDDHWLVKEFNDTLTKYDQIASVDPDVPSLGEAVSGAIGEAFGSLLPDSESGKASGKAIGKILGGKLPF